MLIVRTVYYNVYIIKTILLDDPLIIVTKVSEKKIINSKKTLELPPPSQKRWACIVFVGGSGCSVPKLYYGSIVV